MSEADALVSLRERYPSWEISLNRGQWQANGRLLIRSSSLCLLQAAMDGEPPFTSRLAEQRVRVRANGAATVPKTPCGASGRGAAAGCVALGDWCAQSRQEWQQ